MTEYEYSELQKYLFKNMQTYSCIDKHGFSIFGWETDLAPDIIQKELPTGFTPIDSCQFSDARAWVNHPERVIMTWRTMPMFNLPIVNLYRFNDTKIFVKEWHSMSNYSHQWYSMGE